MSCKTQFITKEGDTLPAFDVVLEDRNGKADLTGCTAVFRMRLHGSTGAYKVNAAAVIANQTTDKGRVTYSWQSANVDTAGTYDAEIVITTGGGAQTTWPRSEEQPYFIVLIQEAL
jgi:hypothetical protein